jgi:hypothetical protein
MCLKRERLEIGRICGRDSRRALREERVLQWACCTTKSKKSKIRLHSDI